MHHRYWQKQQRTALHCSPQRGMMVAEILSEIKYRSIQSGVWKSRDFFPGKAERFRRARKGRGRAASCAIRELRISCRNSPGDCEAWGKGLACCVATALRQGVSGTTVSSADWSRRLPDGIARLTPSKNGKFSAPRVRASFDAIYSSPIALRTLASRLRNSGTACAAAGFADSSLIARSIASSPSESPKCVVVRLSAP
jgi:hypothetical protein